MTENRERMTLEDIERLRLRYINRNGSVEALCSKAWTEITAQAEEITRLRAENERLRAALEVIAATTYGYEPNAMSDEEAVKYFSGLFFGAQKTARAALAQGGKK